MRPLKWPEQAKELQPLNRDPGVQSSNTALDKVTREPALPTITESKVAAPINRSLAELRMEERQRGRLNSEPDVGRLKMRKPSSGSIKASRTDMDKDVPVMIRKDVFYSGSVQNLKEFQSQKSLTAYRNSVISLNKEKGSGLAIESRQAVRVDAVDDSGSGGCSAVLSSLFDVSLLKDSTFMLLAVSNLFGEF